MKDNSFLKKLKQILTFRRISETDAKRKLHEDTWKFYEAEFLPLMVIGSFVSGFFRKIGSGSAHQYRTESQSRITRNVKKKVTPV